MNKRLRLAKRIIVREIGAFLVDTGNALLGNSYKLTPPTRLMFTGGGDYKATGFKLFHYLVHHAALKSDARVLDMGCGIGRLARPLTYHLTHGSYVGVDIVEKGISWCQANITTHFPNFSFILADVHNEFYNPTGRHSPSDYSFPFDADSFDFIIYSSVFTHLLPEALFQYVSESARVLAPGGTIFTTWFLVNDTSRPELSSTSRPLTFPHTLIDHPYCYLSDPSIPESATAYEEHFVLELFKNHALVPLSSPLYGNWSGISNLNHLQDYVIFSHAIS